VVIFIASYPRSGSKLIRMILKQCFDLNSYDIYNQAQTVKWAGLMGSTNWNQSLDVFLQQARPGDDLFLVRIHDFIPDERAIYVVRDGRAVLASYHKFLLHFGNVNQSLSALIEGKNWPGKWSDHVEQWLGRPPTTTLILRYEELSSPKPPLDRISVFVNRPILRNFGIKFSDLKGLDPRQFDVGHNGPGIETVERDFSDLFWHHNGDTMRRLGYDK
jgi:Sulfotransferase domain